MPFFILLISGCVPKIVYNLRDVSVKPDIKMSSLDKIPSTIGIFVPDEFKNHKFNIQEKTFRGTIEVGRSIMIPFYSAVSSVFDGVVFIEDYTPGSELKDAELQLVLFPKIDDFNWMFRAAGPLSRMEARFTLSCEFYNLDGHIVHKVAVSGERSNSTMDMAFSGLSTLESAEMPTRQVFEDVLNQLPAKILSDREKLESITIGHN
jgi:hypothetical protein